MTLLELEQRIARIEANLQAEGSIRRNDWKTASLAERMAYYKTPGVSIAVIDDYQIAWTRGWGVREAGKDDPITPDTLFQAGSISKPVAAVTALRLVDEGKVALDEDVNTYLRSWKVPANDGWQPRITLRQLLSHTAGTTVHGFPGYSHTSEVPTTVQVLDGTPPANTLPIRVNALPGTLHRYSGGGTTIVQQMIEDVTGMPFAEAAKILVLQPLGMERSTYRQPLPEDWWGEAAVAHPWRAKPLEGRWHTYPEMAAAGLWTTATDLAKFAIELQLSREGKANRVLSQTTTREMLTPQWETSVGLGVFFSGIGTPAACFEHSGWDEGFVAKMSASLDRGQGAVVMLNSNQGSAMLDEIFRSVAAEYTWPDYPGKPLPAEPTDPETWKPFLGTYELRPGYNITLIETEGQWALQTSALDPIPLTETAANTLSSSVLDIELKIDPGKEDKERRLTFHQSGRSMPLRRLD